MSDDDGNEITCPVCRCWPCFCKPNRETPTMTDAPRLTDERIRRLAYGDLPRVNEVRSMADELQERRAQQSEGAQAKAVELCAKIALDESMKAPQSMDHEWDRGYRAGAAACWSKISAIAPPHRQTEEKR